jgi:hypothetical protein
MVPHGAWALMQAHGCAGDEVNRCADGLGVAPSWLDLIPRKLTIEKNSVLFNALNLHL